MLLLLGVAGNACSNNEYLASLDVDNFAGTNGDFLTRS